MWLLHCWRAAPLKVHYGSLVVFYYDSLIWLQTLWNNKIVYILDDFDHLSHLFWTRPCMISWLEVCKSRIKASVLTMGVFDHYTYITLLCFPVFTSFLSLMTLYLCHCCHFGFLLVTTFPWASFVVLLPIFVPCNYLLCPYCVHQLPLPCSSTYLCQRSALCSCFTCALLL